MKLKFILGGIVCGACLTACVSSGVQSGRDVASVGTCKQASEFEFFKNAWTPTLESTTGSYSNLKGESLSTFISKWGRSFNADVARYQMPSVPNVYKYDIVDDEKYVRHGAPADWTQEAIQRHTAILKMTKAALAKQDVTGNVQKIMSYMDNPIQANVADAEKYVTNDIVDEALGEIGSVTAAEPLMTAMDQDIARNAGVTFEKQKKRHFWGLDALGNLHYGKADEALRAKVENYLVDMSGRWLKDNAATAGYQGFEGLAGKAFNTPRVRKYLLGLLGQNFQLDWSVIRIVWGWQDVTVFPDLLTTTEALPKLDNQSFERILGMFGAQAGELIYANLSKDDVFARMVHMIQARHYQMTGYTAGALAALTPQACLPQ